MEYYHPRKRSEYPSVVGKILDLSWKEIFFHFNKVLDNIESPLLGKAQIVESASEKDHFILAIKEVESKRDIISEAFLVQWKKVLDRLDGNTIDIAELVFSDENSLSVIDDQVLEEKITLQKMVTDASQENGYLLEPIRSGFEQAMPGRTIGRYTVALFPPAIGECIFESIGQANLPSGINEIIFSLFSRDFFDDLTPIYVKIQQVFEDHGYALSKLVPFNPEVKNNENNSSAAQHLPFEQVKSTTYTQNISQMLQAKKIPSSFFSMTEPNNIPTLTAANCIAEGSGTPEFKIESESEAINLSSLPKNIDPDCTIVTVSTTEIDSMLANILKSTLAPLGGKTDKKINVNAALNQLMRASTTDNNYKIMSQMSENILNLVTLLFEYISNDKSLSPQVFKLLMKLQIPYMRLALEDAILFKDKAHPAHLLLNQLTRIGVEVSEGEPNGLDEIKDVIDAMTQAYGGTKQIKSLLSDLQTYLKNKNEISEERQKKAEKKAYKNEQLAIAAAEAKNLVIKCMKHITNELAFHTLMKQIWLEIIKKAYVRHGVDSKEYKLAVKLLNVIIWSTSVKSSEIDKRQLLRTLPKIVVGVEKVFKHYNIDQELRRYFLDQLSEIHLIIVRGDDNTPLEDKKLKHSAKVKSVVKAIMKKQRQKGQGSAKKQANKTIDSEHIEAGHIETEKYKPQDKTLSTRERLDMSQVLQIISKLKVGNWLEYLVEGEKKRVTLTFYAVSQEQYIFTNSDGIRSFERHRSELLADFQDGFVKVLDASDIFERALGSVVDSVRASCA